MNRKQLISTLVILLAIGLTIFLIMKKDSSTWNSSQYSAAGDKMFADLDINRISLITVSSGANTATLKKSEDGSWSVAEKDSYPGDYKKISEFLQWLPEIKTVQNMNVGKSQLEKLSLGEADKGKGSATLVELSDEKGGKMASLLIGKKHAKKEENPNPMFGGASADGSYVMLCDGKFQPKLVNNSLEGASTDPMQWTEKSMLEVENISGIEVARKNPEESWKMVKDAQGGKLSLADLKEGEIMDETKTQPVSSLFRYLSFKDVKACPAEFAGESLNISTSDGFRYEIKFAQKEGDPDKFQLSIKATAAIPEQREAGKDEKPEDKKKFDKEFKAKADKLKEKLEREKLLGKWLYTVTRKDLDAVLKSRKDFLKSKDEKKEGAPKGAEPAAMPGE